MSNPTLNDFCFDLKEPIIVKTKRFVREVGNKTIRIEKIICTIEDIPFEEYNIALANFIRRRNLWTLPEFVFYGHDVNTNVGYIVALDEMSKALYE
jgi:hypothetical protein